MKDSSQVWTGILPHSTLILVEKCFPRKMSDFLTLGRREGVKKDTKISKISLLWEDGGGPSK